MTFNETKKPIVTPKGIEYKAPIHRENAMGSSTNTNTVREPLFNDKSSRQFKDGKKEYEITLNGTRRINGYVGAQFKISVTKPIVAEALFDAKDIMKRQGVEGVSFSQYSGLGKALNAKGDTLFSMPAEALTFIRDTQVKTLAEMKKTEDAKVATKWFWAIGGDSGKLYVQNGDEIDTQFREDIKKIEGTIERRGKFEVLKAKSVEVQRDTGLYTNQWYEISNEDMLNIYNDIEATKKANKDEKETAKDAIFAKAKATGEKQILNQWSEDCNEPEESCDIDNIIEFAMPDGSTKTERNHTW